MSGVAELSTHDPTCVPPEVLGAEAVIWETKKGEINPLAALPGDSAAAAYSVNENGLAVGASGTCANVSTHAVLWQNSSVTDLGSLGGAMNNLALAINNKGQIAGVSDLPGDTTAHAFLWQNGVMSDLGILPGDSSSIAEGMNDLGQVVGVSCDQSGNCRAFLWRDGAMTDLNTLTPPGFPLYLVFGADINSRGEIVGQAFDQSTGDFVAFLAIPTGDGHDSHSSVKVALPEHARERLRQQRGFGAFGGFPVRP